MTYNIICSAIFHLFCCQNLKNIISFQPLWFGLVRNGFFVVLEPNPPTHPYSRRTWTPHEPLLSFGRGLVQKGGVVRVCVYVCARVCVRARAPPGRMWWAACSLCSHCFRLLLLLSFSSVSVQSGNVDHRGLIRRVSPASPAPCFWLRSVSAKRSDSKVSARRRVKTPLSRSPAQGLKSPRGVDRVPVIKL